MDRRPAADGARAAARAARRPSVRFVPRFVSDAELPAFFRRADVVVLPYTRTERFDFSGVLATALAFGKPTVLSDIGGFWRGRRDRRRRARARRATRRRCTRALARLIGDPARARRLAAAARAAAAGPYSWDAAARDARALPLARWMSAAARRWSTSVSSQSAAVTAIAIVFWVSAGLLVYTQVGYPLLLALLARLRRAPRQRRRRLPTPAGCRRCR